MIDITVLPHVTASLNAVASVFLVAGFVAIRTGHRSVHQACMLAAVAISVAFLIVYLYYHAHAGLARFGGTGWVRPAYFGLLISHVVLAAAVAPLVPWTVIRAVRGDAARHKAMARWTLPLWLYVALTGVAVYALAVHLYPWTGT